MSQTISNSTISNSVFQYNVQELNVSNSTIENCEFQGLINAASITGDLTKCQFQGISGGIIISGPLSDMTIQVDVYPTAAYYVQNGFNSAQLDNIPQLAINTNTVPRLIEELHKECYITTINPGNKKTFMVQIPTDDTNPRGVILMFYPSDTDPNKTLEEVIPKGYALCDGNNGTPDLRGRFIRAASSLNDVNSYDNNDLVTNLTDRKDSIQLQDYHLPSHQHYFKLSNVSIDVSGLTISEYQYSYSHSFQYVSRTEGAYVNEGEGSSSYAGDNVYTGSDDISINFNHSHTLNGTATIYADVTQDQNFENYENRKICIEPNSYALVFIMKL